MKASILSLLAVLCLVSSTLALGTMYINQIRGNDNQLSVNVELVNFKANTVKLDRMFGLNSPGGKSQGTYIEDSELVRGSFYIPHNLIVDNVATISGALHFDGGLHADAFPLAGESFTVDDNTGTTTVLGVTNPNGGINVNKGLFTVEVFTGRTTIASALLRPNGDTVVGASLFKVSAKDGAVTTKGEVDVQRDVVLGTSTSEDRSITRVPSTSTNNPGKTGAERRLVISSQDGVNAGGNLVLEPGYSTSSGTALSAGAIIFGRGGATTDVLTLTRPTVTGTDAGTTTWAGQSGTIGGDVFLTSGASKAGSLASKLVLQVGTNLNGSGYGQIFLGNQAAGADITIRRSSLRYAADGTRTYFRGQSVGPTAAGSNGGRLVLKAGDSFSDRRPGSIVLVPGSNGLGGRGRVKIGDAVTIVPLPTDPATTVAADIAWSTSQQGTQLWVTRQPTASDAGQQANTNNGNPFPLSTASRTNFQGQSSRHGNGGSIEFRAGNSATNRFDLLDIKGADLYLTNGKDFNAATTTLSTIVRRIYWGRDSQPLAIKRDINYVADATSTTIRGQTSIAAAGASRRGGNFFYIAGAGTIRSGDILLQAPDSIGKGLGGSSATPSGIVTVQTASHVFLAASGITGANSNGGNVIINAGQGRANGGNIELTVVPSTTAIQATVVTDNVFVPATTLSGVPALPYRTYTQNQALAYNFVNTDPIGTGGTAVAASGAVPATFFTGYVIATSLSSFKTEEVDFQVNQPANTKPPPVFSLRRDPTANNQLYRLNTATGTNTISRPCNFLNTVAPAGAANPDAYCFTTPAYNPANPGIFFMQLTIPRSTFPAVPGTVTTYLGGGAGAYNSIDQPAFHHVFRYSSTLVPGTNFDTIIAPRYDGVAFSMSDTAVGKNSIFRMNAIPRFSTMYPALWRYTLFDPQVTAGNQGGQPQTTVGQTFNGGSNNGVRIPPYNINPSPANGRITSNTNAAIPTGLGNAALGNLYAKSKTAQSFRGVIFDIALNLNRVICALHNIGYVQAYERPWKTAVGANTTPLNVAIPANKRCDPTPTRLLRFLQIDPAANALFYGNKFVAPTYSS